MSSCPFPSGVTEASFLEAVGKAADVLADRFEFGYYTAEDIRQEVAVLSLEALPRFDPGRGGLAPFFYQNAKNRLHNLKRALVSRTDYPCRVCHEKAVAGGQGHEDGRTCKSYGEWAARNQRKKALMWPEGDEPLQLGLGGALDQGTVEDDVAVKEILAVIDERLPLHLRPTLLRMREGARVSREERIELMDAVSNALLDGNIDPEELGLKMPGENEE